MKWDAVGVSYWFWMPFEGKTTSRSPKRNLRRMCTETMMNRNPEMNVKRDNDEQELRDGCV